MSEAWAVVLVIGAVTVAMKGLGPLALGGRPLPAWAAGPLALLAPAVLAALVVTQTVGGDEAIVLDARVLGVAAAAVAIRLGAPVLVVTVVAAVVAAVARLA